MKRGKQVAVKHRDRMEEKKSSSVCTWTCTSWRAGDTTGGQLVERKLLLRHPNGRKATRCCCYRQLLLLPTQLEEQLALTLHIKSLFITSLNSFRVHRSCCGQTVHLV